MNRILKKIETPREAFRKEGCIADGCFSNKRAIKGEC